MITEATNSNHHNLLPRGNTARLFASALAVAALSGELVEPVEAQAQAQDSIVRLPYHDHSVYPGQLHGARIKISQADRQLQADASTTILVRGRADPEKANPGGGPWQPVCTGVKLRLGPISVAPHCVPMATQNGIGNLSPEDFKNDPFAADFVAMGPSEFGIGDPLDQVPQAIAQVQGLSVSTRNMDIALIKAAPSAVPVAAGSRSLDQKPGLDLPYDRDPPIPGQQVGLYGISAGNHNRPVSGTGTYLGRSFDASGRLIDLVGTSPKTPETDPCYFEMSGGSFVYRVKNKRLKNKLFASGPLSIRSNRTFDMDPLDNSRDFDFSDSDRPAQQAFWKDQAEITGVKLGSFTTLCGYAVRTRETFKQLVGAFGHWPEYRTQPMSSRAYSTYSRTFDRMATGRHWRRERDSNPR
ncbi:MAG: hypothetical protein JWO35_102 [Candidatus Saccharibacteria bacterium]|nr:hypothetical protein [Candidatus Saccharibacteria bacterium]